jgi:hypothetical protein
MPTVLTRQIASTDSGLSSDVSLDDKKEPRVTTSATDIPPLGVAKDEKRFFWQKTKVSVDNERIHQLS